MALKSNEVRKGNLVFDSKGKVRTINAWDIMQLEAIEGDLHQDFRYKEWRGIPLDEEKVLSLGFSLWDELNTMESGELVHYRIGDRETNRFFSICYHPIGKWTTSFRGASLNKPEFIHQLQNTVFVLIGVELEIKPA